MALNVQNPVAIASPFLDLTERPNANPVTRLSPAVAVIADPQGTESQIIQFNGTFRDDRGFGY